MSINKLKKHQEDIPYTMASREVIQSLNNPVALAIWAYLQSLPENWNVSEGQLRTHFGLGKVRYREAMKQLKEAGLYSVTSNRTPEGKFIGSSFNFYPIPQGRKPDIPQTGLPESVPSIKEKNNTKEEDNKNNGFSSFWENYGKVGNKQQAERAWNRLSGIGKKAASELLEQFRDGLPAFQERGLNIHASTYLNQKRWEDESQKDAPVANQFAGGK